MEYIQPSFEILAMTGHSELPYQYSPNPNILMEVAGRTCYKTEKPLTVESSNKFVDKINKDNHLTVLEHSCEGRAYDEELAGRIFSWKNKYLEHSKHWTRIPGNHRNLEIISGNSRSWMEFDNQMSPEFRYDYIVVEQSFLREWAVAYNEPQLMRATVRIICDRGVTHEWVRHRPPAQSQESTRFVNYLKRLIQFIIPPWVNPKNFSVWSIFNKKALADLLWLIACFGSEWIYCALIKLGWSPQQARSVLINSLKTEIVTTTDLREFQHIFAQRALGLTGKPHPQMKEVALPMMEAFEKLEPSFFNEKEISREYK